MNVSTLLPHDSGEYAVITRGLTKHFADKVALDAVEFCVPRGAVYVLCGANGAGKSTALKLLMNLERADAGTVEVFGMKTDSQGPEVRAQVGYVPETTSAGYGWMTCARLLSHMSSYYPAWESEYARHLCNALDIAPKRRVESLSKGQVRRLQLVLALAHRPALMLLDEPTDGLDPIVRKRVLTLLTEHLSDSPATVVVSTHQVYEVESLVDHVGVLRDGRLVAQLSRDELVRTVRRYLIDAPDGWTPPGDIQVTGGSPPARSRGARWTLRGNEPDVVQRLALAGAVVRDVSPLGLEDAVLAFLGDGVSA